MEGLLGFQTCQSGRPLTLVVAGRDKRTEPAYHVKPEFKKEGIRVLQEAVNWKLLFEQPVRLDEHLKLQDYDSYYKQQASESTYIKYSPTISDTIRRPPLAS